MGQERLNGTGKKSEAGLDIVEVVMKGKSSNVEQEDGSVVKQSSMIHLRGVISGDRFIADHAMMVNTDSKRSSVDGPDAVARLLHLLPGGVLGFPGSCRERPLLQLLCHTTAIRSKGSSVYECARVRKSWHADPTRLNH